MLPCRRPTMSEVLKDGWMRTRTAAFIQWRYDGEILGVASSAGVEARFPIRYQPAKAVVTLSAIRYQFAMKTDGTILHTTSAC